MHLEYITLYELLQSNIYTIDQIKKSYLLLLSMLTFTPDIENIEFTSVILQISKIGDIVIAYYFDIEKQELIIVGSGTIIYEPKIIHGGKSCGHIEDIVVHKNYRQHGIAKNIIEILVDNGKKHNCYKIILDCNHELEEFYKKIGFDIKGLQMANYFT
uniref:N-acetyltransferase domain-containing protein n=1 Tax=viral metagenome TaxID=1070528 RepID=A0A6C0DCJ0_9ZZZZ